MAERDRLQARMGEPGFWDNQEKAQHTIKQIKPLNDVLKPYEELSAAVADVEAAAELGEEDASLEAEVESLLTQAERKLDAFEMQAMLAGAQDGSNAYLKIKAGAGGTEACDWAQMLMRMYARWAERQGFAVELMDEDRNEEAGIRTATLYIKGDYAFGNLQGERGVHRLVRISPFDANARRQTSFAAVDVVPELDDSIHIEIRDDDLERQTFRSGGPGGQHQNKTESGVRFIHKPTGIAAESRTERSQHKNADNAMRLLKAKLYQIEEQKQRAEVEAAYDAKGEVSFGSQIRNYTLQPYTLVKDTRTDAQTGQAMAVLDGDIDLFIQAFLRKKVADQHNKKA